MRYDVLLFWTCAALSAWLFTDETTATTTKCWMRKLPGVGGQNPTLWRTNIDLIDCVCLCVNQVHSCEASVYDVKARSCYSDMGKKLLPLQFFNRYVKTCGSTCDDDFELVGKVPPSCISAGNYRNVLDCEKECLKDAKCQGFIFFNVTTSGYLNIGCCPKSSIDVPFSPTSSAELYVRRMCLHGLDLEIVCPAPTTTTTALVRTTPTKPTTTVVHTTRAPGPCLSNPCEASRGTCIDEWLNETHATYRCQCHSQYTGEFCQYEPVGTKFTAIVILFMCLPASVFVIVCCVCLGKGAKYYYSKYVRRIRNRAERNLPAAPDPAPAAQPAAGRQAARQ